MHSDKLPECGEFKADLLLSLVRSSLKFSRYSPHHKRYFVLIQLCAYNSKNVLQCSLMCGL